MEADFEGEKFDLPDQPDDKNDDSNSDNEEELDRGEFSSNRKFPFCNVK